MSQPPGQDRSNPYVGPRSFARGERLYGRSRELRELLYLLVAERLVLLYSPSGAGKTSLIQAELLPALERKKFGVLPIVRVSGEPPAGAANRYVASTMASLEEGRPAAEQLPGAALAGLTLADYLDRRAAEGGELVLIFDQFEEILTVDPAATAAKEAFFAQLGAALESRRIWALFAMREDYIAQLDPYLRPIPNRLKDTFRLDLLGPAAARQAMQAPALAAGVSFSDEAAARLVDDLRRTVVQRPDGASETIVGPHVEPVQLQVVCYRLWRRLFADGAADRPPVIAAGDVEAVGDVDRALADYYVERIGAVAAATGVGERILRDWFDRELISAGGLRSQVLQQPERSGGLDNRAIRLLIDAHLLRAEQRRGATWFELAHDRLVGPIAADNAAWRAANLSALQRQAAQWDAQGRPDWLLLRDEALTMAEAEADEAALDQVERDFLAECREARAAAERERLAARRIRWLAVGLTVGLVLALASALFAFQSRAAAIEAQAEAEAQRGAAIRAQIVADAQRAEAETQRAEAEEQRAEAEVQRAAAEAQRAAALNAIAREALGRGAYQQALLLAVEAVGEGEAEPPPAAVETMYRLLGTVGGVGLPGAGLARFSADGAMLAVAQGQSIRLWKLDSFSAPAAQLAGAADEITALVFSPNGQSLFAGARDGSIYRWSLDDPGADPLLLAGHRMAINLLAVSPDGRTLASNSEYLRSSAESVRLWDLTAALPLSRVVPGEGDTLSTLSFSHDGSLLAVGSWRSDLRLYDPSRPEAPPRVLRETNGPDIRALAWHPAANRLALSDGAGVELWDLDRPDPAPAATLLAPAVVVMAWHPTANRLALGGTPLLVWDLDQPDVAPAQLGREEHAVRAIAWSQAGDRLITGEFNRVIVWGMGESAGTVSVFSGHEQAVEQVSFSPAGRLFSVDSRGLARAWDPARAQTEPEQLAGAPGGEHFAFSPNRRLVALSFDRFLQVWDIDDPDTAPRELAGHEAAIRDLAFSPDGRLLATAGLDSTVRVWDVRAADPALRVYTIEGERSRMMAVAFSPDSQTLAAAGEDGDVRLWTLGEPDAAPMYLRGHTSTVFDVAFSPDGRTLASGGGDGLKVWDLRYRNYSSRQLFSDATVRGLAFDPQGTRIAVAGNQLELWNVGSPYRLGVLPLPTEPAAMAFSPDGRRLATIGGDLHLWDLDALATPRPILLDSEGGRDVAFAADGATLLTAGLGIQRWRLLRDDLVEAACIAAGRNLRWEEWAEYIGAGAPYRKTCPQLPAGDDLLRAAIQLVHEGRAIEGLALAERIIELDAADEFAAAEWQALCNQEGQPPPRLCSPPAQRR